MQQHDDDVVKENATTFTIIEGLETQERIKFYSHLITRKQILMDNHGAMIVPSAATTNNGDCAVARKDSTTTTAKAATSCDLSEHQ
mmetsp:Transcript_9125/g.20619  ORF Transcript_9125/g.20619 Transcript_9125/m.20619 type:complete len:86 (-) Transcript_9125:1730-1987(-)